METPNFVLFVYLQMILAVANAAVISTECQVNVNLDLPTYQPLLLKNGGTKDLNGFFLPDATGVVHIKSGESVLVACPGKTNLITKLALAQTLVTCQGNNLFNFAGVSYTMADFNCASVITNTGRKNTAKKCEITGNFSVIEIGFEIFDKSFYVMNEICFDDKTSDSIYAKFIQLPAIAGAEQGDPRPAFVEGTFYPTISVNTKYEKTGQIQTFTQILGSAAKANQYIGAGDYYLARGHLTARADYVYDSQQRATFWYVNAAPQWQTFNGGNWQTLEDNVRNYVASQTATITIYTGTHGIATLPDVNNVQKPLYLSVDTTNIGKIKVPEVYWKVLYEPKTLKAIAFVGVNNPYVASFTPLCTDICSQVQWLTWQPNNQISGYSYCCNVNELRTKIPSIPSFQSTGVLL